MARELDYEWRLRLRMAERGLFATRELAAGLAERGIELSHSQAWRLMTGKPERLSLRVLVALCDLLECAPNDLIEPVQRPAVRKRPREQRAASTPVTPVRARVTERETG